MWWQNFHHWLEIYCCCSVTKSYLTLCDPMDCSQAAGSSVIPFSFCPQSFTASNSFPMSRLFASGGQSIGASALASSSFLSSNGYSGLISFRIDWFDLLAVQGTLKSLLQHWNSKASILQCLVSLWSNSHIHTWLLKKPLFWLCGPLTRQWYLCFLICCLGLS